MSKSNSRWLTDEDVERDLYEYSQLPYPVEEYARAPPKSIAEYRARTSKAVGGGLFDEETETPAIFVSGRGKYIKDRVIKPGLPTQSVPEDEMRIKKKLREVSGLGYGNEVIENAFANKFTNYVNTELHEEECNLPKIPDLKLQSPTSGSSSSSRSTTPSMLPQTPKKKTKQLVDELPEEDCDLPIGDLKLISASSRSSSSSSRSTTPSVLRRPKKESKRSNSSN